MIRNFGTQFTRKALLAGVGLAALCPVSAWAQDAEVGLQEIVVTAQKREQRLQDVPVAVTVLSGDVLDQRGSSQIATIASLTPSLTLSAQASGSAENSSVNLRGVGTFAFSPGVEAAVAVIVDDIPLIQQGQVFIGLADIQQIEVLRGPQGTLFGKNASAGVVNIITRGPSADWTGSVNGLVTSDEEYRVQGSISGPISANAGFRLSGHYGDREGYIRNLETGHWLGGSKDYGVRGRVDLEATDRLDLSLIVGYSNTETTNPVRTFRSVPDGARFNGALLAPAIAGITPGENNFATRLNLEPHENSEQTMGRFRLSYDLGSVDLISITTYQDWNYSNLNDNDGTQLFSVTANAEVNANNFTQELRLASKGGQRIDYVAGLFFSDGDTTRAFKRGPAQFSDWTATAGNRSYAAFAQGTFNVTPQTHLDLGARLNRQEIDVNFIDRGVASTSVYSGDSSEDAFTYKVALRQDLNDRVMAYASYATGYKGQGFDITSGFNQARADNPVDREDSKSYEVGLKGRFFDNRLRIDLVAFLTNYKNFQAQGAILLPNGTPQFILNNVGRLRTKGIELDGSLRPVRNLRIDFGAAYTDATMTSFPNAQCYTGQTAATGCVNSLQDLSGARLPNAPKFKYSFAVNYDIPLPSLPFDAFIGGDYRHQSSVHYDLFGDPLTTQAPYGIANLRLGIQEDDNQAYSLTLFVNNLFDKQYAAAISNPFGFAVPNTIRMQILPREAQRYFGARLGLKF